MIVNGIDTKDISVVVQGAVSGDTKESLRSVRKFLPEAEIILSTWQGTDVHNLDYDHVLLSKDPGSFPCDAIQNSIMNNINRQIVSTYNGLKHCSRHYAVKMRSDFYFKGIGFLDYFGKFDKYNPKYRFVKERIINCSVYSRNPRSHIYPLIMPYCPSDFFFFGLLDDLINLFNRELIENIDEKMFFELHPECRKYLNYKNALCQYMPEQSIWMGFLKKYIPDLDCICRDHITEKNIILTEKSFANNLVICSAEQIGIDTYKADLFKKGVPENCLTHQDWLDIYSYYCRGNETAFKHYVQRTRKNEYKYKENNTNTKHKDEAKSVENLQDILPLTTDFDIVSFDIFDTLVFRHTAPDWQALAQTSEYISMLLCSMGFRASVSEIDSLRNSYSSFYGNRNVDAGGSQEYKIREVVSSILRHYGIPELNNKKLTEQIVQNELKRECSQIFLNEEVLPVLNKLHEQGKTIIAISDMYFSYQDIYSILEATGIAGLFNKIYVSSEFNKTKADGKIYNVVTNDLGVKPCNILHIGDNIHSDVRMAEDNGFKCIYYNNKENIARKNKLEQQVLGQMHKKYIEDALLITEKSVTFCDYIQNYFSFDIINFVYDLSKKMHKEGIQKAFFMERDGVLYGKIYRELSKKLLILDKLPEIECVNLKLSRKDTALLVNLEEIKDVIERAYKVNPPTRFHIIHILGCFGINLSDFSIKMQRQIVNHNSDSSYFEKIYFEYIYPLLLRKKNNVVSYLDKMGFFSVERVAMVDIGWGGTSQCDIEFYLSHNYERHICYGFYYACDDRARILAPYYSQYHYGPDLYYAYSLLEFIVKEYTSDLSDLKDKSERKPFLAETYKLNYDSRVQIYSDIDRFVKAVNQLQLTPEQIRQVTYPRLKSIIDNPPEEFVLLVKEAQYSLDRKNNDEYMPLLKKVEVLNELDQQYEKAQWVQASLVSSGKIINRLVLMKNCYFSIIFNPSTPRIIKKIIIFFGHHLKKVLDRYGFY